MPCKPRCRSSAGSRGAFGSPPRRRQRVRLQVRASAWCCSRRRDSKTKATAEPEARALAGELLEFLLTDELAVAADACALPTLFLAEPRHRGRSWRVQPVHRKLGVPALGGHLDAKQAFGIGTVDRGLGENGARGRELDASHLNPVAYVVRELLSRHHAARVCRVGKTR